MASGSIPSAFLTQQNHPLTMGLSSTSCNEHGEHRSPQLAEAVSRQHPTASLGAAGRGALSWVLQRGVLLRLKGKHKPPIDAVLLEVEHESGTAKLLHPFEGHLQKETALIAFPSP